MLTLLSFCFVSIVYGAWVEKSANQMKAVCRNLISAARQTALNGVVPFGKLYCLLFSMMASNVRVDKNIAFHKSMLMFSRFHMPN